jgi:uncharacterized protein
MTCTDARRPARELGHPLQRYNNPGQRRYPRTAAGFLLALALAAAASIAVHAAPQFPALTGPLVDEAQVLSPAEEEELSVRLRDFRTRTGNQLQVATVAGLQGYDIETFANLLHRHWALGEKDKNNGVLLLVAPKERKVRIEVGYGLEGTLTDALSRLIIENAIVPRFRTGDVAGGVRAGVDDIIRVLSGEAQDLVAKRDETGRQAAQFAIVFFVVLIIAWILVWRAFQQSAATGSARRRGGGWVIVPSDWSSGSSGGSGWSSGGSSGGWSGGGGSSGGGGASGSW